MKENILGNGQVPADFGLKHYSYIDSGDTPSTMNWKLLCKLNLNHAYGLSQVDAAVEH